MSVNNTTHSCKLNLYIPKCIAKKIEVWESEGELVNQG